MTAAELGKWPNIQAVLDGRVSGGYTEWPQLRVELRELVALLREAADKLDGGSNAVGRYAFAARLRAVLGEGQ